MRLIALDTETTGMCKRGNDVCGNGHRVIEIGCVEIVNNTITGRFFHSLINPRRSIDPKAKAVHGISDQDLENKPEFKEIVEQLMAFIGDSTLIIHNAPFDIAFLDQEFHRLEGRLQPQKNFTVIDTLQMARKRYPGADNSLAALSSRYNIGLKQKENAHSALLDAEILARIYIAMDHS